MRVEEPRLAMKSARLTVRIKLIRAGLATVVSLAFSSATLAQPKIKPEMIAEFEEALEEAMLHMEMLEEEAMLHREMPEAWDYVPEGSRCKDYLDMAASHKRALRRLNAEYAGRVDAEYRRRAQTLLSDNRDALDEYKSCFRSVVSARWPSIASAGFAEYEPFIGKYNTLTDDLGTSLQDAINKVDEITRELEALRSDTHPLAGELHKMFRQVEVSRRGGDWQPAVLGQVVYVGDRIRTGPRGRARIVLDDEAEAAGVGPTVINVGSSSEVMITHFAPRFESPSERNALVVLIQGVLRAFSAGWGSRSAFSVRVGTSLCGARGTEIAVSYDAQQDSAEYWLHHGDAYLRDRHGTEFTLTPATVTTVSAGERTSERSFAATDYAAIVENTEADPISRGPGTVDRRRRLGGRPGSAGRASTGRRNIRCALGLRGFELQRRRRRLSNRLECPCSSFGLRGVAKRCPAKQHPLAAARPRGQGFRGSELGTGEDGYGRIRFGRLASSLLDGGLCAL